MRLTRFKRTETGLECDEEGVWVGPVPLFRKTGTRVAPRSEREIRILLQTAYGPDQFGPDIMWKFNEIAKLVNSPRPDAFDLAMAQLWMTRLNPPPLDRRTIQRLIQVNRELEEGQVRKSGTWNPALHPRWPAGEPDGGEFAPVGAVGPGTNPTSATGPGRSGAGGAGSGWPAGNPAASVRPSRSGRPGGDTGQRTSPWDQSTLADPPRGSDPPDRGSNRDWDSGRYDSVSPGWNSASVAPTGDLIANGRGDGAANISLYGATVTTTSPADSTDRVGGDGTGREMGGGGTDGRPVQIAEDQAKTTAEKIVEAAEDKVGSTAWSDSAVNGNYGRQSDKCNLFVYDVLTEAGASPGLPHGHLWHRYPPLAADWADPNYEIPGWRVLGPGEQPQPGDVVAQQIGYRDASGHVMIVGPDGTVIGTGNSARGPHGTVEQIPEPDYLGAPRAVSGPKVYRRWTGS